MMFTWQNPMSCCIHQVIYIYISPIVAAVSLESPPNRGWGIMDSIMKHHQKKHLPKPFRHASLKKEWIVQDLGFRQRGCFRGGNLKMEKAATRGHSPKAATCGHSGPLAKSGHSRPLAATRGHSPKWLAATFGHSIKWLHGCGLRVAASGCKWLRNKEAPGTCHRTYSY